MLNDIPGAPGLHDLTAEGVIRRPVSFGSGTETLAGDLVLPASPGSHPAIPAVAGTGAQNRYGDIVLEDGAVLPHGCNVHPLSEFFIHSLIGWTLDQLNLLGKIR